MRTRSGRASARGRVSDRGADSGGERYAAERTLDGRWLVLGKDGRLSAYARSRDGLLRWTETRPGGPHWSAPELFAAPDLTHLSVVQGADTYVHFLGRRARGGDELPAVDVVHAIQYQTARPVTEWRSVGNPHKDQERAARLGAPVGAVSASGRVHVLVPNAGGGLMLRREGADGRWEAWADLKGSGVRDGVAALAHASGRVEVLAGNRAHTLRWSQAKADGALGQEPNIALRVTPGTLTLLETAPDRATYYWADLDTGGLLAHRLGGWVIPLGQVTTGDRIAALRTVLDGYDCTVLAHRGPDGHVMLAACGTENEGGGLWWSPTGESGTGAPALALDGHGRVVLGVIGQDGALHVARQADGPGLSLDPAVRV
ncbi:hypothetical protein ABZ465_10175 [Streptomyces griseoincarnatus]